MVIKFHAKNQFQVTLSVLNGLGCLMYICRGLTKVMIWDICASRKQSSLLVTKERYKHWIYQSLPARQNFQMNFIFSNFQSKVWFHFTKTSFEVYLTKQKWIHNGNLFWDQSYYVARKTILPCNKSHERSPMNQVIRSSGSGNRLFSPYPSL